MERVAFLLEQTNERLICLLNPETLTIRRNAGIRARGFAGGQLTGVGLADDPLLYTGGGRTEIELDLLFDVDLGGSTIQTNDVRNLTTPFWNLAENRESGEPPLVRLIWGKYWNIPGVISAIAERLEDFTPAGAPQRSWMRMRMLRVRDSVRTEAVPTPNYIEAPPALSEINQLLAAEQVRYYEVTAGERLDDIAFRFYGSAAYWRLLAEFNAIVDPNTIAPGLMLLIPPAPSLVSWLLSAYEDIVESIPTSFTSLLRLRALSPLRIIV